MSFLDRYESAAEDRRPALIVSWIRNEWREFFAELRERRPIMHTPLLTLVTRFPDVVEVLSRERVFTVRLYAPRMDPFLGGGFMLSQDDTPLHWAERGLMQSVLPVQDVPRVRHMAAGLADEALDRARPRGRVEAVAELARHVQLRVCREYFGLAGIGLDELSAWSRAAQTDIFRNLHGDPAVHAASLDAGARLRDRLHDVIDDRRAHLDRGGALPDDVLTRLLRGRPPEEVAFGDRRVLANMAGLLVGSVENTAQAVAGATRELLSRDGAGRAAVAAAAEADPARFDAHVWEALRFAPPNRTIFRLCESDHVLAAGTPRATLIPAGTLVFACVASAMFDADAVPDPCAFRADRPAHTGLHFGHGPHLCLGRHLGAAIVPEVVRRVLLRPGVRLLPRAEAGVRFGDAPSPAPSLPLPAHPRQAASW
ncbi:cytochrome P450 [Streptosporangium sp. NPDC048865]|uniref:cytochrome P450 n=1 Tax=Streptosporangium sp. NPDC048865 TaxID=3155766 RepID=UPI0034221C14